MTENRSGRGRSDSQQLAVTWWSFERPTQALRPPLGGWARLQPQACPGHLQSQALQALFWEGKEAAAGLLSPSMNSSLSARHWWQRPANALWRRLGLFSSRLTLLSSNFCTFENFKLVKVVLSLRILTSASQCPEHNSAGLTGGRTSCRDTGWAERSVGYRGSGAPKKKTGRQSVRPTYLFSTRIWSSQEIFIRPPSSSA